MERSAECSGECEGWQVGNEKRKTKVIKKELNPEWQEKFELPVDDLDQMLKVQVWDKDLIGSDDLIGETALPLSSLVGQRSAQKWHALYKDSQIQARPSLCSCSSVSLSC
jgi:stromal membrane-associated protein